MTSSSVRTGFRKAERQNELSWDFRPWFFHAFDGKTDMTLKLAAEPRLVLRGILLGLLLPLVGGATFVLLKNCGPQTYWLRFLGGAIALFIPWQLFCLFRVLRHPEKYLRPFLVLSSESLFIEFQNGKTLCLPTESIEKMECKETQLFIHFFDQEACNERPRLTTNLYVGVYDLSKLIEFLIKCRKCGIAVAGKGKWAATLSEG